MSIDDKSNCNLSINNESIDLKPHINIYKQFEIKAQKILNAQLNTNGSSMSTEPPSQQAAQSSSDVVAPTKDRQ